MDKITPNTLIPISFIAVAVGFILWLSQIYITAQANAQSITDLKADIYRYQADEFHRRSKIFDLLRTIDRRLSKIEGHLDARAELRKKGK